MLTKHIAVVAAYFHCSGIQIFPYLDDWQVWGRSRFYVQNNILVIRHLFSHLGLKLNGEKWTLQPTQRINFVGVDLASVIYGLSSDGQILVHSISVWNPPVQPKDYLPHLKCSDLSIGSVTDSQFSFHLCYTSSSRWVISVFSHPLVSRVLKALIHMDPFVSDPVPSWDLNLVLSCLMRSPFKLLATTSLSLLSMKAILVAITSVRKVSQLQALLADHPFTIFHQD